MENLIYLRGQVFIGILTFTLIIILIFVVYYTILLLRIGQKSIVRSKLNISHIKSVGLLALVIGVLDQLIGLNAIFSAIEEAGDITANIVLNALIKSMFPLIYGVSIFIFSYLVWIIFDMILNSKLKKDNIS